MTNILQVPFYVVTKPRKLSVIEDICFKSTFSGMELQYKGGLKFEDIYGIYNDEAEALRVAGELLAK